MSVFQRAHQPRYQQSAYRREKTPHLEITTEVKEVILSSLPEEIPTHWVFDKESSRFRARRCSEDELCIECWRTRFDAKRKGHDDWLTVSDVVLRIYFLCMFADTEHWIELGVRHVADLDKEPTTVGLKIAVWKQSAAAQGHKYMRVVKGGYSVQERHTAPFLGSFCLPPRLCSPDDAMAYRLGRREIEATARPAKPKAAANGHHGNGRAVHA